MKNETKVGKQFRDAMVKATVDAVLQLDDEARLAYIQSLVDLINAVTDSFNGLTFVDGYVSISKTLQCHCDDCQNGDIHNPR